MEYKPRGWLKVEVTILKSGKQKLSNSLEIEKTAPCSGNFFFVVPDNFGKRER